MFVCCVCLVICAATGTLSHNTTKYFHTFFFSCSNVIHDFIFNTTGKSILCYVVHKIPNSVVAEISISGMMWDRQTDIWLPHKASFYFVKIPNNARHQCTPYLTTLKEHCSCLSIAGSYSKSICFHNCCWIQLRVILHMINKTYCALTLQNVRYICLGLTQALLHYQRHCHCRSWCRCPLGLLLWVR
jgi:hypothetical protein